MFTELRRDHGVRSYLAQNMTVTPANLDQVAGVVATVVPMGYSMLSFQLAAFLGDDRRWKEGYRDVGVFLAWAVRRVRRCGGLCALVGAVARRQVSAKTFEVHSFMDAADVAPAWALMQAGQVAEDPAVRATQEWLAACAYTMAHPETGSSFRPAPSTRSLIQRRIEVCGGCCR